MTSDITHVGSCSGGNSVPMDAEGRPYHYGCKGSEIVNEFLLCSCYNLAKEISKLLEGEVFFRASNRGYHTYTGMYKGKRVSIVAFGIGFAMLDFLLREIRAITTGKLTFIQIGEAPSPSGLPLGTCINVKDAVAFEIDYGNFTPENDCPYTIYAKPVKADETVFNLLAEGLKKANLPAQEGRVASNPSFVSGINAPSVQSGGLGSFDFKTEKLMKKLNEKCGTISTFEMDTYMLYWTALREFQKNIKTGAISVVSADMDGHILPTEELIKRQVEAAKVILEKLGELQ
ncbi:hypothetical protein TVAG_359510 [Trichomonas vaginalis G3]|uniref:Nucleoside phosphorylase domain-containing protein n=1 Tax=Trichomonas vaginalis (strain ATCC PRA-98 / G3) TaxID=412133 RepID=A2DT70_TRIV3|nr:uridine phosphorylase family [Trichomonas vaginalis G3]EAY16342.1 hypothetical protein TVAG_359510 [Trichomonas vaginalis G3]KAI5488432.1 uridine phosphorylase family [Trichomonas vaginalis G3]|eukprot:XP_001328565.1 hypothetical protein [Trichomonas vaginalis G3]